MTVAIIVASGRGERLDTNQDTAFLCIGSRPVVAYSMMAFEACSDIQQIILVVRRDKVDAARGMAQMFGISKIRKVVAGSATNRQDAIIKGLEALPPEAQFVVVHNSSRPLVTPEIIAETIKTARKHGSGVTARRVTDTIKQADRGTLVSQTVDSSKFWIAETPQAFTPQVIKKAYETAVEKGVSFDDDATAVQAIGEPVRLVEWSRPNIQINIAADLATAARLTNN